MRDGNSAMKIKVKNISFDELMKLPKAEYFKPLKQSAFMRNLMAFVSKGELKDINFTCEYEGMERLKDDEPALFLMNHSSFTDLGIAATLLKNRQYHIVMTNDGFVGKLGLMRRLGCIPAKKFIADPVLVKDMKYCFDKLNSSVLMYPEASYSFDGTQTPLPESLGKCIKLMGVPVVMIRTVGAFLRDPLYNNLQKRAVTVRAKMTYLYSPEDIGRLTAEEINGQLAEQFNYDHFKEQFEEKILIKEDFRADGLERALYKCPKCNTEGKMVGKGTKIICAACNDINELAENGKLQNVSGDGPFEYVSDWYAWERAEVKKEIGNNSYRLETPVDIMVLSDFKSIYRVGEGVLTHDNSGMRLVGCDGKLDFAIAPQASYSLYADYFWYEIGDMISIGNSKCQYYCFPKKPVAVAKARLATEELYKLAKKKTNKRVNEE